MSNMYALSVVLFGQGLHPPGEDGQRIFLRLGGPEFEGMTPQV